MTAGQLALEAFTHQPELETTTDQEDDTMTTTELHSVTCQLPSCCATTYTASTPERAQALHDQHHQPRVPSRPDARTIRRHLKARGLEQLVEKVSSGRQDTHVTIALPEGQAYFALNRDETYDDSRAQQVAAALRELWTDGDARVRVLYSGKVLVRKAGWTATSR